LGQFPPIARDMAREELHGVLSSFFESRQCSGRGDKLAQVKQRLFGSFLHDSNSPFADLAFAPQRRGQSRAEETNGLHGGGGRLSVRAVKGAGVWRSSERSGDP